MDTMNKQEMISAMADGQLRGEHFARGVEAATEDAGATWHAYHLIGEVLRTGECTVASRPSAFMERLQAQLAQESAPAEHALKQPAPAVPVMTVRGNAANDGSFRWKMVAGLASVAAVTAVGWAVVFPPGKSQQAQLAAAPANAVVAATAQGAMIRDARLDEFLAAHRELGSASALPTPAGFLRNATFETPTR